MKELENISKEGYNYIEEMFIKEYGYRYEELIRNRLSKTNYIFKSPPDITYFSLKELGYNPKKYKSLEKYYSLNQIELLRLTNFGKELTKHISNTIDGIPYYKALNYARKILFNDVSARTYPIKVNGNSYTIVHIPILELKDYGSIDHFLIHENIHSIESNNGNSGIIGFHNSNYVTNELKTESKTIRLHNKMKKDGVSIFDTEQNYDKTENFYTPFVPLMDYLYITRV